MPCRDFESDHLDTRRSHEATLLKERADMLARVACRALNALEQFDPDLDSVKNTELRKFWANHKKADQARIQREEKEKAKLVEAEKLRETALSKLTLEEIAAFGLGVKSKAKRK